MAEEMSMEIVLDLQTLEVPKADALLAGSCTSSTNDCCNSKGSVATE